MEQSLEAIGETQPRKKVGRKKRGEKNLIRCCGCGFESNRAYNVLRHYSRIHGPMKRRIYCCDSAFLSKADYYRHCAQFHPMKRKYTLMTRTKYKMVGSEDEYNDYEKENNKEKKKGGRKSARRRSPRMIAKLRSLGNLDFANDESSSKIWKESERPRRIVNGAKSKIVKIFFQGNLTSPKHAEIQSEFLADIDFESFKLPTTLKANNRLLRLA